VSRTFFTDRDLGKQFPDILRAAGLTVERHADHFSPDATDEEWLEKVGRERWTAITHDTRIRYKPNELSALVRHRVGLLVVVGHAPYQELARNFVATARSVEAFLRKREPPFIAKVYRPSQPAVSVRRRASGRVELWYPR
jgi:hypothetical protein